MDKLKDNWIDNKIYCGVVQCSVYKSTDHWTYRVMVCGSTTEGKADTEQEAKTKAILTVKLYITMVELDFKQFMESTK